MSSMLFLRSVGRASAGVLAAAMVVGMAAPVAVAGPVEPAVVPVAGSTALVSPTTLSPAKDTCKTGFVWREAYPGDVVCVSPKTRDQARVDNVAGPGRVDPGNSPACKTGFVWREAGKSDRVCVTPKVRQQTAADNAAAAQRRAASSAAPAEAKQWSFHGSRKIYQYGSAYLNTTIFLEIDQTGSKLNGTAYYYRYGGGGSGRLTGSITGNTITFTVTWNNRSVGVYKGVFRPDGSIRNGNTYDRKNPSVTAAWHTY